MRPARLLRIAAIVFCLGVGTVPVATRADDPKPAVGAGGSLLGPRGSQMMLRADQVDYNLNTAVTVAHGHVEIDYNDRIVQAEQVIYDQNKDVVTAEGHVVMMAPDGNVVFATHAVLTDQMRDGVIETMSALIGANGRMASPHAVRTNNGMRMVAQPGVFTPCKVCNKPGQKTPLWSVKAQRVVYDELAHRIYYHDAIVNLMGVPVLYTPFFTHPDPTVKHSSGVLQPEVGSHSTLGYMVRVPVYVAFTDSQDATLAPLVSQRGGEQLELEYRQRWDDGGMWWQASVANDPHGGLFGNLNQTYSSIFGAGIVPLDSTWHVGFDAQLTSYSTYLQRFDMTTAPRLTNDLYLEGINGQSRFSVTGYFFEGLQATDNNSLFPVVLPLVDYTFVPQNDVLGGDFQFDFNTAAASTRIAENDQRASGQATLRWPFVSANGQLLTIQAEAKGDIYHISDVNALGPTGMSNDQYVLRGSPYIAMDWRWPFVSPGIWGMNGFVVQPIAQVLAAPYGDNPKQLLQLNNSAQGILNGDSADFELDETNIFDFDRLPGYDLVESGPRATVGTEMEALYPSGSVDFLVGQSYRLKPDPVLGEVSPLAGSGFSGRTSDLVSRLTVNFLPNVSVSDRIDIDTENDQLARNEIYLDANYGRSSVEIDYLRVPPAEELLGLDTREEVKGQALIGLWDYWLVYAAAQRDLAAGQMISEEIGLGYQDECFGVSISYKRDFTQFRDLIPSSTFLFRISLQPSELPTTPTRVFPTHLYPGEVL
jgi:LPS-assembly protein